VADSRSPDPQNGIPKRSLWCIGDMVSNRLIVPLEMGNVGQKRGATARTSLSFGF